MLIHFLLVLTLLHSLSSILAQTIGYVRKFAMVSAQTFNRSHIHRGLADKMRRPLPPSPPYDKRKPSHTPACIAVEIVINYQTAHLFHLHPYITEYQRFTDRCCLTLRNHTFHLTKPMVLPRKRYGFATQKGT